MTYADLLQIRRASPALLPSGGLKQKFSLNNSTNSGPAIPWRRANVKHTSNELYVDIVESLSVTLAPSGRPLAAFANGSIAFTAKISGVPDLLLSLTVPGGKGSIDHVLELPVFHPCVRLARWKEKPGELSFVPPDGKFMLAGYEVNLLPPFTDLGSRSTKSLNLPATVEVSTSLGPIGSDFEVRLLLSNTFASGSSGSLGSRTAFNARGSGRSTPVFGRGVGSSTSPVLEEVVVTIPISAVVRNVTDLRASRGEAHFNPIDEMIEWRIPTKETSSGGNATLRCTVVGPSGDEDDEDEGASLRFDAANGEYDEKVEAYQSPAPESEIVKPKNARDQYEERDLRKVQLNAPLMPTSASVSFSVKGWLASGVKVNSLVIDAKRSKGLGENVKPYKGVKYLTVSRKGVETRC